MLKLLKKKLILKKPFHLFLVYFEFFKKISFLPEFKRRILAFVFLILSLFLSYFAFQCTEKVVLRNWNKKYQPTFLFIQDVFKMFEFYSVHKKKWVEKWEIELENSFLIDESSASFFIQRDFLCFGCLFLEVFEKTSYFFCIKDFKLKENDLKQEVIWEYLGLGWVGFEKVFQELQHLKVKDKVFIPKETNPLKDWVDERRIYF